MDEMVVDDDIRRGQTLHPTSSDQAGIARAGADEVNDAGHRGQ